MLDVPGELQEDSPADGSTHAQTEADCRDAGQANAPSILRLVEQLGTAAYHRRSKFWGHHTTSTDSAPPQSQSTHTDKVSPSSEEARSLKRKVDMLEHVMGHVTGELTACMLVMAKENQDDSAARTVQTRLHTAQQTPWVKQMLQTFQAQVLTDVWHHARNAWCGTATLRSAL